MTDAPTPVIPNDELFRVLRTIWTHGTLQSDLVRYLGLGTGELNGQPQQAEGQILFGLTDETSEDESGAGWLLGLTQGVVIYLDLSSDREPMTGLLQHGTGSVLYTVRTFTDACLVQIFDSATVHGHGFRSCPVFVTGHQNGSAVFQPVGIGPARWQDIQSWLESWLPQPSP